MFEWLEKLYMDNDSYCRKRHRMYWEKIGQKVNRNQQYEVIFFCYICSSMREKVFPWCVECRGYFDEHSHEEKGA